MRHFIFVLITAFRLASATKRTSRIQNLNSLNHIQTDDLPRAPESPKHLRYLQPEEEGDTEKPVALDKKKKEKSDKEAKSDKENKKKSEKSSKGDDSMTLSEKSSKGDDSMTLSGGEVGEDLFGSGENSRDDAVASAEANNANADGQSSGGPKAITVVPIVLVAGVAGVTIWKYFGGGQKFGTHPAGKVESASTEPTTEADPSAMKTKDEVPIAEAVLAGTQ
jgi:cobalamin biosynthesis Mg chelatase CobN